MKGKTLKRTYRRRENNKMKGTLGPTHLQLKLGQISGFSLFDHQSTNAALPSPPLFQNPLHAESSEPQQRPFAATTDLDADTDTRDFILSQDFFCTPDYITPDNQNVTVSFDRHNEVYCPKSPEKLNTVKLKRLQADSVIGSPISSNLYGHLAIMELDEDIIDTDELPIEKTAVKGGKKNYISQSAIALRCRVMPPPCFTNPYLEYSSETGNDPFGAQRSKCAGFFPEINGGQGLSRYHADFHEIEQIGNGSFSRVFKVLKRIDGCLYAIKRSTRQLHLDTEKRKALMEVQALAALGFHENINGYYNSWFEDGQFYIQLELCDCSLSNSSSKMFSEREVLEIMHQIAKALAFIHKKGVAHLDVKPENIYVKNGIYKLGDFGCATLLNKSLPIEEGDARYMPQEILNDNHDHLDKVDIFSLGAAMYELVRGSPLPESGQFFNLREGKLPLLPGHSLQFQNLLKAMVDGEPHRRPSAEELLENSIFDKIRRNTRF